MATAMDPLGEGQAKSDRVAQINALYKNVFAGDDTDNHDYYVKSIGKGRGIVALYNATDQTATISVYGSFDEDGDIGDDDIFQIGSSFTVTTASGGYECFNDPFPFYIIRVSFSVTPDGSNASLYVGLFAY